MTQLHETTAPCGIDCFNCQVYGPNLTPESRPRFAAALHLPADQVDCAGCRASGGCRLHWGHCETLDCVRAKGVDFCHECDDFPCRKLLPSAESAVKYPHNLKVFNLARIRTVGLEQWARESRVNRTLYFTGRFVVGAGPQPVEDAPLPDPRQA